MLRILPISLAQSKAENNSEKLKNEILLFLYSLQRLKSVKVLLTLFKDGKNFYEQQKQ